LKKEVVCLLNKFAATVILILKNWIGRGTWPFQCADIKREEATTDAFSFQEG